MKKQRTSYNLAGYAGTVAVNGMELLGKLLTVMVVLQVDGAL